MRLKKLREKMAEEGFDAFLVTDMKNIYYLTGFSGTAGVVFVSAEQAILLTDGRYTDMAREILAENDEDWELIETRDAISSLSALTNAGTVMAFEDSIDFVTFKQLQSLAIGDLRDTHDFIAAARQIKDPSELAEIRKACKIADEAFYAALKFIAPGVEEIDVANFLDFKMRELGASGISFETIVASGVRSSLPHGVATHKPIATGEAVTIDFGCFYNHYASDMTRTIFVGEPDAKLAEIYEVVRQANESLIQKVKAGLSFADYDKIPRDVIKAAGYGEQFTHGIGHGFGLDIHEIPYFGVKQIEGLQENMTITDEPGVYLSGIGGVRIEDDLLITADGCEVLTQSSKELIIL